MEEDLAKAPPAPSPPSTTPPPPPPPLPNSEPLQAFPIESEKDSKAVAPVAKFGGDWRKYATLKMSTEFDSESSNLINKVSARVMGGIAKVKASFQRDGNGEFKYPQLGLVTKHLSVLYDHDDRNALVTAWAELGSRLQLKLLTDAKAQQGELKLLTNLDGSRYKAEVSCDVPSPGLPRASVTFPNGEIKLVDEVRDESRALSINGLFVGKLMNGLCTADYRQGSLNLKYAYKDDKMTFIPSVSLPSQELSFAFKRQFNPLNKLSYLYNFNSAAWSAVYKHKPCDDLKIKVGYDSVACIGWASAWVGKEEAGAKRAPMKTKFQIMLQVPQDDVKSSVVLFRVKKRWDL